MNEWSFVLLWVESSKDDIWKCKVFFAEQKISEIGTMQYGLKDLKHLALVTLLYCSRVRFLKIILKFTIFKEKIKVQKINVFMFLN